MASLSVIERFSSTLLSCTEGFFHFPVQTCHPFLMNLELKIYIFPHIHALSTIQHAYMKVAPLQPMYIGICSGKYKNEVRFPCHDKRYLILGLPYT
jgi:hypothetical protein